MTHVTCRLTAKNRDQLRNPTLGNRVWATFTFYTPLRPPFASMPSIRDTTGRCELPVSRHRNFDSGWWVTVWCWRASETWWLLDDQHRLIWLYFTLPMHTHRQSSPDTLLSRPSPTEWRFEPRFLSVRRLARWRRRITHTDRGLLHFRTALMLNDFHICSLISESGVDRSGLSSSSSSV